MFYTQNRYKKIFHLESRFFILTVLGILMINFTTCLESTNIADFVKQTGEAQLKRKLSVSKKICETPTCVNAAYSIINSMDTSANPCKNFYQFACGNFVKKQTIPDDQDYYDKFAVIGNDLQKQLKESIESEIKEIDSKTFKLLQTFYKTCLNIEQIEKTSENDLKELLKKIGGWPVLEGPSWNENSFDWRRKIYDFRKLGLPFSILINIAVTADLKNTSVNIVDIDQPALGLEQEYLSKGLEEKAVQAYLKFMIDFAEIFGADREVARKELSEVLNFEVQLSKILLPEEARRDIAQLQKHMTVQELENKIPSISWLEYINNLLQPQSHLQSNDKVTINALSFFEALPNVLVKTPKRVLANYLVWRAIYDISDLLGERVRNAKAEFDAAFSGVTVQEARWKTCVNQVSNNLDLAIGALYVRRHFDQRTKSAVAEIVGYLRNSYESILKKVKWMDEKTRKTALEKLQIIEPHIAYPVELLDDKKLDKYYQNLTLHPESFLKSYLNLSVFYAGKSFEQLHTAVNRSDWRFHGSAAVVNAFYAPTENSITLPAGILQGDFFGVDKPYYLNFGSLGFVIGHELTHGFDDVGRQFDKSGNLAEWWQPETKKHFIERAQCIIDQYSNYTVKEIGLKINGINTGGENIADNGGVKEAYFAYLAWEKANGKEARLPGLPYTSRQMFWISAASLWCNKFRPEALRYQVLTNEHSPGEFRVIGSLSNIPEFAKDYNCPLGSPMNPVKKCTVW